MSLPSIDLYQQSGTALVSTIRCIDDSLRFSNCLLSLWIFTLTPRSSSVLVWKIRYGSLQRERNFVLRLTDFLSDLRVSLGHFFVPPFCGPSSSENNYHWFEQCCVMTGRLIKRQHGDLLQHSHWFAINSNGPWASIGFGPKVLCAAVAGSLCFVVAFLPAAWDHDILQKWCSRNSLDTTLDEQPISTLHHILSCISCQMYKTKYIHFFFLDHNQNLQAGHIFTSLCVRTKENNESVLIYFQAEWNRTRQRQLNVK